MPHGGKYPRRQRQQPHRSARRAPRAADAPARGIKKHHPILRQPAARPAGNEIRHIAGQRQQPQLQDRLQLQRRQLVPLQAVKGVQHQPQLLHRRLVLGYQLAAQLCKIGRQRQLFQVAPYAKKQRIGLRLVGKAPLPVLEQHKVGIAKQLGGTSHRALHASRSLGVSGYDPPVGGKQRQQAVLLIQLAFPQHQSVGHCLHRSAPSGRHSAPPGMLDNPPPGRCAKNAPSSRSGHCFGPRQVGSHRAPPRSRFSTLIVRPAPWVMLGNFCPCPTKIFRKLADSAEGQTVLRTVSAAEPLAPASPERPSAARSSSRAALSVGPLSLWDRQPSGAPPLLLSPAGLASRRGPRGLLCRPLQATGSAPLAG